MKVKKLSPAQLTFLDDCARSPNRCVAKYPPALALLKRGFITAEAGTYTILCTATDAGRAYLAENKP